MEKQAEQARKKEDVARGDIDRFLDGSLALRFPALERRDDSPWTAVDE